MRVSGKMWLNKKREECGRLDDEKQQALKKGKFKHDLRRGGFEKR